MFALCACVVGGVGPATFDVVGCVALVVAAQYLSILAGDGQAGCDEEKGEDEDFHMFLNRKCFIMELDLNRVHKGLHTTDQSPLHNCGRGLEQVRKGGDSPKREVM